MKPVEPVPIVVAKAKIKGAAQIELQALSEVKVKAKQPVHVKYLYRLEEVSQNKENWRFHLASQIGTQSPPPAQAVWEDRWGRNDSLWGVLQQEFVFDKPGTYDASFTVDAEYRETDWKSSAVKSQNQKKAQGTFKVRVIK